MDQELPKTQKSSKNFSSERFRTFVCFVAVVFLITCIGFQYVSFASVKRRVELKALKTSWRNSRAEMTELEGLMMRRKRFQGKRGQMIRISPYQTSIWKLSHWKASTRKRSLFDKLRYFDFTTWQKRKLSLTHYKLGVKYAISPLSWLVISSFGNKP